MNTHLSRIRRVFITTTALIVLSAPYAVATIAGAATTTPPVTEAVTGWNYNGIWAGSYRLDSGLTPVYCIKAAAYYPVGPYAPPVSVADSVNAERIGYLIDRYGASVNADTQAALAAEVGLRYDTANPNEKWNAITPAQRTQADNFWAQAGQFAGPYQVSVSAPSGLRAGSTYTADVRVYNGAGTGLPNQPVTIATSGINVPTSSSTTNASGHAYFSFSIDQAAPSGIFHITASTNAVQGVLTYQPTGSGYPSRQAVMGAAPALALYSPQLNGTYTPGRPVAIEKVATGDPSHTPVAGAVFSVTDSSASPVVTVTSGASPVSIGTLIVGSTYNVTEVAAPPGYYIPVGGITYPFTVTAGSGTQIVAVSDPRAPSPTLTTSAKPVAAYPGTTSTDTVTISGNDNESGTLTGTLVGPVAPTGSVCSTAQSAWASAPVVSSTSTSVTGNTTATLSVTTPNTPGCYAWNDTLSLSPSNVTVVSLASAPGEQFRVVTVPVTTMPVTTTTQPFVTVTTIHTHATPTTVPQVDAGGGGPLTPPQSPSHGNLLPIVLGSLALATALVSIRRIIGGRS
jgi:hypothetical protein